MSSNGSSSSSYDQGNIETGVGAAMIALSVIFVVLRFYARIRTKAGLGGDDWLVMVALTGNVVAALLVLAASTVDPNSDWIEDNTDLNYHFTRANKTHLMLAWISSILYFTLVSAAKLSILLLYDRIFSASQSFHRQIQVAILVVSCYWVATTIACVFNCWPLKYSWVTNASPEPYCFNFNVFWCATGVIEVVLDVCIILLPVRMVMKLNMGRRQRLSLVVVFSLGAFGIVTGIVKVYQGYAPGRRFPNYNQTETWSAVHGGIGLICSCLPVCWRTILEFSSKVKKSKSSSAGRSTTNPTTNTSTPMPSWWLNHKPSLSWPSSSASKRHSQLSRHERGGEETAQPFHLIPGTSDVDLCMVPVEGSLWHAAGNVRIPVYPPQVRVWSDGTSRNGERDELGHGIQVDRHFSAASHQAWE